MNKEQKPIHGPFSGEVFGARMRVLSRERRGNSAAVIFGEIELVHRPGKEETRK